MKELKYCPGNLSEGFSSYSPIVLRKLFGGRKVSHILPYNSPENAGERLIFNENQSNISISGYQEKYSLVLEGNNLRLSIEGEHGQYILKPITDLPKNSEFAPANEHVTMQIAKQIFGIDTAENALVFFKDGNPAYITKRFDYDLTMGKLAVEDFASLMQKSPATHGETYKYEGNYLELFSVLKQFVPAWKVEAPKLFSLILFNYIFSNGDAHLKNFSLIETKQGDFKLSPAYDLINTNIHTVDSDFALDEGLLPKSITKGKIKDQFILLGEKAKIPGKTIEKIMLKLTSNTDLVADLVERSYLSEKLKRNYLQTYQRKLKKLI